MANEPKQIHKEGRRAFFPGDNDPEAQCPYTYDDWKRHNWLQGWHAAQADHKAEAAELAKDLEIAQDHDNKVAAVVAAIERMISAGIQQVKANDLGPDHWESQDFWRDTCHERAVELQEALGLLTMPKH